MQEGLGEREKKKFNEWIKGEAFYQGVVGGGHDIPHVWVAAVFCHKQMSLCHLSGVCLSIDCFKYEQTRPIKDQTNKRKPECSPSSD